MKSWSGSAGGRHYMTSSLFLLVLIAAQSTAKEVEIITEPRQGEEYVNIQPAQSKPAIKESKSVVMTVSMSKSSSTSSATGQRPARQTSYQDKNQNQDVIHHQHQHHQVRFDERPVHHNHREQNRPGMSHVEVNPEGLQGTNQRPADSVEKQILENKSKLSNVKKDSKLTKNEAHVEIRDSGNTGVKSHKGIDAGVPSFKHVPTGDGVATTTIPPNHKDKYEIIGISGGKYHGHENSKDEGNFDFVDLSDGAPLKASGTSQASRISVKKGPNGQDYEYEYVYYYYDEDDELPNKKDDVKPATNSEASPVHTTTPQSVPTVTPSSHKIVDEHSYIATGQTPRNLQETPSSVRPVYQQHNEDARYFEESATIPPLRPFQQDPPSRQYHDQPSRNAYQDLPPRGFQQVSSQDEQPTRLYQEQPVRTAATPSPDASIRKEPAGRPHHQESARTSQHDHRVHQQTVTQDQEQSTRNQSPEPVREVPKGAFRIDPPVRGHHHQQANSADDHQESHQKDQHHGQRVSYQDQPRRIVPHSREEEDDNHRNSQNQQIRGRGGSRFSSDRVPVTTQEPLHNEVVPTNTRLRSRGRGNAQQQQEDFSSQVAVTQRFRGRTQETPEPVTTPPRIRTTQHTSTGVRRPSLELVDSSSFRTHNTDNGPPNHQDIPTVYGQSQHRGNVPALRGRLSEDTRESDLPEYIDPRPQQQTPPRPTVAQPPITTIPPVTEHIVDTTIRYVEPHPAPVSVAIPEEMPEKAALDLYALLSAANQESRDNEIDPDLTTIPPTTTPTTTTTTTTTITTTTPPPSTSQVRGRFRGGSAGRTRLRPTSSPRSTPGQSSSPAPQDSQDNQQQAKPVRSRFSPNRSNIGRSRLSTTTTTTSEPPTGEQQQKTPRPSFTRLRTRPRNDARPATRTTEPTTAPASTSGPAQTPARSPSRVRPLRPGPRLPIRPAAQQNQATEAPIPTGVGYDGSEDIVRDPNAGQLIHHHHHQHQQETDAEGGNASQGEGAPPQPTDSTLTRLRNRPRLSISQPAPRIRPIQPNIHHGLPPRRKVIEEQAAPIEEEVAEEDIATTPIPVPVTSEPPVTESRLTSLIRRRRPGQRISPGQN